MRSKYFFLIWY